MASTSSTSMSYNASSTRFKTAKQQEYTRRKVDTMNIRTDAASLFYSKAAGSAFTVPFTTYTSLFTNSSGNFHPTPSRLGKAFKGGTKWNIIGSGTRLQYQGQAFMGHVYAHVSVRPDASANRILSITIDSPGSTYTEVPEVSVSGAGSGEETTAVLDVATQTVASITINNGGSGWGDNGTSATIDGNATISAVTVGKRTSLELAIYKNGELFDIDATTSIIGDPANAFTSTGTIRFLGPIAKDDIFDLRIKTDSTVTHAYHIYQAVLSIVPIEFSV